MSSNVQRPRRARAVVTAAAFVATTLVAQACSAPGGDPTPNNSAPVSISTDVGAAPVTLRMRVNGDQKQYIEQLAKGFSAQHPNVTVKITAEDPATLQQNGPRILAGGDPPDLLRLPTMGDAVRHGLVVNLDPYAQAYGWDRFPQSQFTQLRVSTDGRQKGTGSLYGVGLGFGIVGVYYNKKHAAALGVSKPPATLAEFESLLAKAKAAGMTPLIGAGNNSYLFQELWLSHAGAAPVSSWVLGTPKASIDSPEALQAAATVQGWAKKGYFPADVLAIDETAAVGRFGKGEGVFYVNGNWFANLLDKQLAGNVGFFPFPAQEAGRGYAGMSAPLTYVIPTKAKNATAAAAFINWAVTSPEARRTTVAAAGIVPGGPSDQLNAAAPAGTALADTLTTFQEITRSDGLVGFLADASENILARTLNPQTQLLMSNRTTPAAYIAKIQADYERDLGQ